MGAPRLMSRDDRGRVRSAATPSIVVTMLA
jgi:hypothetical protein